MTIAWTSYTPHIKPYAPSCPDNIIEQQVLSVVIDFCEKTLIWRETMTAINTVVGTGTYTIVPPTNTRVVLPIELRYDDNPVTPKSEEELDWLDTGWRTSDDGVPNYYFCPTPNTIRFNRTSDEAITGGITGTIAVKPDRSATGGDDIIYDDWLETIREGVLHRLYSMKDKHWSSPQEAVLKGQYYSGGVQNAKARAKMGHSKAITRVRQRRWV